MTTFLGIGSNLGDRAAWLRAGLAGLRGAGLVPLAESSVWETAALDAPGGAPAPPFLNMVIGCETTLTPREVLERLLAIEARSGRRRTAPNAARTLDLDLLCMGQEGRTVVDEPGLTLPHPRMWERRFVLEPLSEIAPHLENPANGNDIARECARLRDRQEARRLGDLAGI